MAVTAGMTAAATGALSAPAGAPGPAAPAGAAPPAADPLAGRSAAVRGQAAAWVARQVSRDAIVACDPAMCAALQAHGIAPGNLLVLRPSSADPLGSDVVIATPAVRSQFGRRLASVYAPVVIASFGTGALRIDVRAMAPDGAAAYRAALAADLAARRGAGQRVAAEPAGQRLGGRPERPRRGPGRRPAAADARRRGQRRAGAGRGVHRLRARGRPGRAAAGGRADRAGPGPRRVRPRPRRHAQAMDPAPPRVPRCGRCSPSCARSARPTAPPGPGSSAGPGERRCSAWSSARPAPPG